MTQKTDKKIATLDTKIALPRENGELVFQDTWEARAFGLAVALNEKDLYEWREFSSQLASEIADAEQNNNPSSYYARWVASLEELLIDRGLISREQLDARTAEYASGIHDHHHDH
ncbi:MAG: nitrile hydratase accessory protein [Gemmatimonadetes bacterium]|nr:nitrile hydratase accessory protein [Gemmatimonadota bacterium]MYF74306.1 nitrile hydratase accessory protein [Gemmatimonadota bacterium]MYK51964.1 nitrile hydratase accessory protein [Gemmatimonadota bacterium]